MLKHVDLRRTPSLEFALLLVFAYLPYGLAEGLRLSGIMAILFCGLFMSHYTHFNLSPMTQITMQQTFRTLAFVAETCVFAYLGLALFTFPLTWHPILIVWSVILCLIGRALNIFPLSWLCNRYRSHPITRKMQFVMWFSGLRGAIAFALTLYTPWGTEATRNVMIANTLAVVIFTTVVMGGATMPLLAVSAFAFLQYSLQLVNKWFADDEVGNAPMCVEPNADVGARRRRRRRRRVGQRSRSSSRKHVSLSKTQELVREIIPLRHAFRTR